MVKEKNSLLKSIVEGLQEKKAKRIVTVDLRKLDASCDFFVICEGDSTTHISAIGQSVKDYVKQNYGERPIATDGFENCLWVALDYGNIIVHVFQREARDFYDLEHLWNDAKISKIEDL